MASAPVQYNDDHPTLGLHLPGDDDDKTDAEKLAALKETHQTQISELVMQMDMELGNMKEECDKRIEEIKQEAAHGKYTGTNTDEDEERIG